MSRSLTTHHRQHCSRRVHRPDQIRRELTFDLNRRHLFEVPLERRAGAVHEHVDSPEAIHRSSDRRGALLNAGDIKAHGEKVGMSTYSSGDLSGPPSRSNHGVTRIQSRPHKASAHTSRRSRNEPDLALLRRRSSRICHPSIVLARAVFAPGVCACSPMPIPAPVPLGMDERLWPIVIEPPNQGRRGSLLGYVERDR